ncbi:hypothetical protein NLJ89_g2309 [Agrocybe chaxingu]|uniref:Uncharacterized protein n=1 Tax=Agrocybe chaxingu TaxID=84603 RepID=A0A9W8MWL1_9AGAR|nr:hypothetical protein NLJ89_g2309 [Agrocybe chaxingu]
MSRDTRRRVMTETSEFGEMITARPRLMRSRGSSLSTQDFNTRDGLGTGLEAIGGSPSFNNENGGDATRVTMQTRVAVRDKTPHRFQVVPLRDASKYAMTRPELSTKLPTHSNHQRNPFLGPPSGKPSSVRQARTLESLPSSQSVEKVSSKSAAETKVPDHYPGQLCKPSRLVSLLSDTKLPAQQVDGGRRLLSEVDLNRERRPSITGTSQAGCNATHEVTLGTSRKFQTVRPVSRRTSVISDARSTMTSAHTISRSLQLRARYGRSHPKSQSLSDFDPSRLSLLDLYTDRKSLALNDSQDELTTRVRSRKDAQDIEDLQLNRRHAIYSESAFLPYVAETGRSSARASGLRAVDEETISPKASCGYPARQIQLGQHQQHLSSRAGPETVSTRRRQEPDKSFESQTTPRRVPRDLVEIKPLHGHSHPSLPLKPLNYKKASNTKVFVTGSSLQMGADTGVYPKIILDIFADLDVAIWEWNTLC